MKKIFTLALGVCLAQCISAQNIQENNILAGGTLGYSRQHVKNESGPDLTIPNVTLNPSIGTFYRDNRVIGLNLSYGRNHPSDGSFTLDSYGVGIFVRQYLPLGKSFYAFAEEGASVSSEKNNPQSLYYRKRTTGSLYFYPGLAYGITKHFQLEVAFGNLINLYYYKEHLSTYNGSVVDKSTTDMFSLATGTGANALGSLNFGVKWLL